MANITISKYLIWFLIAVGIASGLLLIVYFIFPELITKLTSLLVGLFLVVTGIFFRRKK